MTLNPNQSGDRRCVDRRRWTEREARLARRCAGTGARFVGVQAGVLDRGVADLALFVDRFGRTFALRVEDLTTEAVRAALAQRWGTFYVRQLLETAVEG